MPLFPAVETPTHSLSAAALDCGALRAVCQASGLRGLRLDLPVGAPADVIHEVDFSMRRYADVLPVPRGR